MSGGDSGGWEALASGAAAEAAASGVFLVYSAICSSVKPAARASSTELSVDAAAPICFRPFSQKYPNFFGPPTSYPGLLLYRFQHIRSWGVVVVLLSCCLSTVVRGRRKIRWRGASGAWTLSGAPLSMSLSGVCLCACLLSDGGMISSPKKNTQ